MKAGICHITTDSLAAYIRKLRIESGYSQYHMAGALEISQNAYCLLENGRTKIHIDYMAAIAPIFQLSLKDLLMGYFDYIEEA